MSAVTSELAFSPETYTGPTSIIAEAMSDTTHLDCFDMEFQMDRIGSSPQAIRSILDRLRKGSKFVTMYARFTNVPPDVAKLKFSKACHQMYNPETRAMIITLPGRPHDAVAMEFTSQFIVATFLSNMKNTLWSLSSARVEGTRCSKEPDGSWIPKDLPASRNDTWPTIVLEVGVSESLNKLRADAAWWLSNSKGDVNLVIIISINQAVAEVTFESIVLQQPPTYMRNGQRQYRPHTRQSIVVSRAPSSPGQPINTVPNTLPLKILFEEVLCRPPQPPETDPVISISSLEEIASAAWRWQGL
ncbi:hypothetical protein N7478_001760 [Penicillium angulare]|uniref:uncharacterized protein n=1 Tax=Penicillium angulare TaxID=116970 RepID=UPI00254154AF|nr:uncharacterized protein N7478_001760 [Penicillium angulare]KAJ5288730.1 hypothetical protein N7478_001760 [Penicillium angulare]